MGKNILSNVKTFYFYQFFRECVFWIPIITLFWQSNGLSLAQIMLLQSAFALAIVILEIPTGTIADKVGRKFSLTLSAVFSIIGFSIYAVGTNFSMFLAAEIVLAFASTFMSGADSALLYDSLKQAKKENLFNKVRGNAKSLAYLAVAIASIIGGIIASYYGMRITILMSIFTLCIMFLYSLRFIEPKIKAKSEESYQKHVFASLKQLFGDKQLLFIVLFSALVSLFARTNLWFYQPYMKESGLPLIYFGIVWASFNFFAIIGSKSAHKLEAILGEKKSLWLIVFLIVFSTIFASQVFLIVGIVFIFLQQFNRGFVSPVLEGYTHKHLESHNRATLMSIQSMIASLFFAILAPFYGLIADNFSLSVGMFFTGISALILFLVLMAWKRKIDNSPQKSL